MRIGHLENAILLALLKNGAQTSYELAVKIEGISICGSCSSRSKAFFRTIKKLREKKLITPKPYFKFEERMYGYMARKFWAAGCYWLRYNGSGFHRVKTKRHNYGYYWRYGLTSAGKKEALKKARVSE